MYKFKNSMNAKMLLKGVETNDERSLKILQSLLTSLTRNEYTILLLPYNNYSIQINDLYQQVYYEFLKSYKNFHGDFMGQLYNFLKTLVHNTVKQYIVHNLKYLNALHFEEKITDNLTLMDIIPDKSEEDFEISKLDYLISKEIIDKLSPINKDLYYLIVSSNFHYEKYCDEKNVSYPAARKRVERFKKTLKKELNTSH